MSDLDADAARRRRQRAARKHQPELVRLLLVAEAPPSALDRYFYFEDVPTQDGLFRYVVCTVLGEPPSRGKAPQLARLRDAGVFLIDLKTDPKIGKERLNPFVGDLVRRAVALEPEYAIPIKANVCDLTAAPLRDAGLAVSEERVPFPGSGQQRRFEAAMGRALKRIGWRP